jgi:hypothetical protein
MAAKATIATAVKKFLGPITPRLSDWKLRRTPNCIKSTVDR